MCGIMTNFLELALCKRGTYTHCHLVYFSTVKLRASGRGRGAVYLEVQGEGSSTREAVSKETKQMPQGGE